MVKIVIIDDEKNVRIVIKKLLSLFNIDYKIVGEAGSVTDAVVLINKTQPDIVLLDIELEDGTGFDILKQLKTIDFQLIFITAFNEYAVTAFKFNALDYILKPIDPEELKDAIKKAIISNKTKNDYNKLLSNFKKNKTAAVKKLVIRTTQKTHYITIDDIYYFQSDGSYSKVISKDLTILASKNLKYFQEILPKDQFIRTHQSYLVNRKVVKQIKSNMLIITNQEKIPISVRRIAEIKKILAK